MSTYLKYIGFICISLIVMLACSVSLDDFYSELDTNQSTNVIQTNNTTLSKPDDNPTQGTDNITNTTIIYTSTDGGGTYAEPVVILTGAPEGLVTDPSAYITVSGTDIVQYRYKLDSGVYTAPIDVSEAIQLTNLTNGEHTLSVIGSNPEGRWQQLPETVTWTIDSSLPIVQLSTLPPKISAPPSALITVGGYDVENYRFQIDGLGFSTDIAAVQKISLSGLSDGEHTIDVIGQNSYGVWQETPTSYSWSVNSGTSIPGPSDPPTGTIEINSNQDNTTSSSVTLTINAQSYYTLDGMRFKNDDGTWSAWQTYDTTTGWTLSNEEGDRMVFAQFSDENGAVSDTIISDTILLDLNDPSGTINIVESSVGTLDVSLELSGNDGAEGSGVEWMQFKTDNGTWSDWLEYAETYAYTMDPGPFSTRTVYVKFKDASGRISAETNDTVDYTLGGNDRIYVKFTGGNDGNDGLSPGTAVKTINEGITKAQGAGAQQVHIMGDTYTESIALVEGVSLFGGFNSDFTIRDTSTYVTIITQNTSQTTITAGSGITNNTVLNGLTIKAPTTLGGISHALLCDEGSPTVSSCIINNNCNGTDAYGVFIDNGASPVLKAVDITLDATATNVTALHADNNSSPEINSIDITIQNGSPTNKTGIYLGTGTYTLITDGSFQVQNNRTTTAIKMQDTSSMQPSVIEGMQLYTRSNTYGYGIIVTNSSVIINRCFVEGGVRNDGTISNYGIKVIDADPGHTVIIKNSIIYGSRYTGGSGNYKFYGYGIYLENSSPIIANNTIFPVQNFYNDCCSYDETGGYAVYINTGSPVLINNIIRTKYEPWDRRVYAYGVWEANANSDPMYFQNNIFFSDNNASYYHDADTGGNHTTVGNLNDFSKTTQLGTSSCSNNMISTSSNVFEAEHSDWHLKAGSDAINAGRDTHTIMYGQVTVDKDNKDRSIPYDIGAYEY